MQLRSHPTDRRSRSIRELSDRSVTLDRRIRHNTARYRDEPVVDRERGVSRRRQRNCGVVERGAISHGVSAASEKALGVHLSCELYAELRGRVGPWGELSAIEDSVIVIAGVKTRDHALEEVEIVVFGAHRRVAVYRSPAVGTLNVSYIAAKVARESDCLGQLDLKCASRACGRGPTIDDDLANLQAFVFHPLFI